MRYKDVRFRTGIKKNNMQIVKRNQVFSKTTYQIYDEKLEESGILLYFNDKVKKLQYFIDTKSNVNINLKDEISNLYMYLIDCLKSIEECNVPFYYLLFKFIECFQYIEKR